MVPAAKARIMMNAAPYQVTRKVLRRVSANVPVSTPDTKHGVSGQKADGDAGQGAHGQTSQ